jgi:prophage DNA circulation protein
VADALATSTQPASYEGIAFPTGDCTVQGGHAGAEHTVYRRRGADIESTGQEPYRGRMTLLMVNDLVGFGTLYPGRWQELRRKFETTPIGELRHPTLGTLRAFIKTWDEKDDPEFRSGVIVEVEWVEHLASATQLLADDPGQSTPTDAPSTVQSLATTADAAMATAAPAGGFTPTEPVVTEQLDAIESGDAAGFAGITRALDAMLDPVVANLGLAVFAAPTAHPAVVALEDLRAAVGRLRATYLPARAQPRAYVLPSTMALWEVALAVYGDATRAPLLQANNSVADPTRIAAGRCLLVPPLTDAA